MTWIINASDYTYIFQSEPNYLDPFIFNGTGSGGRFNFQLFNNTFYVPLGKSLRFCPRPPPPTPFPMARGNEDGWVLGDKKGQSISGAFRRASGRICRHWRFIIIAG